ncbi:universal stress protein [Haloarchaeobius sp. HRN-SO-5]|uniref:universal stress protein n=1 Tax=Haloarchaeobius sp. HRN-SO-5 TaxID=3446118 RepID=UPI003EB89F79
MHVLAPVDGSPCSLHALEFAVELTERFDGTLDVVHVGDPDAEATEQLLETAREVCAGHDVDATFEAVAETDSQESRLRYASKVGAQLLAIADERDVDHIVMGTHGREGVDEYILGSAAKAVLKSNAYPVTILP